MVTEHFHNDGHAEKDWAKAVFNKFYLSVLTQP